MARTEGVPRQRRVLHALTHSLRLRLVALFLLLALAMSTIFLGGMQKAMSFGWRDLARPLMTDYVDRLATELGSPPSVQRAQALIQRLPLTVSIHGPQLNWVSHPHRQDHHGMGGWRRGHDWRDDDWERMDDGPALLRRTTADGHQIEFGLNLPGWRERPQRIGWITLAVLLLLTALAYAYVRRLLRPLDDIRAGAGRFGKGNFQQAIPVRSKDELGELAGDINAMGQDIHQMLEAKRALLLAISHELRSPLTRARLNTELLPDQPELADMREALLRDLALMRDLVTDLLESERLASRHAALQVESTDLAALAREVLTSLDAPQALLHIAPDLPALQLDAGRMRLLLRNLLDNALRHSTQAATPPELHIRLQRDGATACSVSIAVRDHGSGVDESALAHLAEPFYRPDNARQRATGGVGLGLYLCKLVAQAHGGSLSLRNAAPGLEVQVVFPVSLVSS